MKKILFFAVAAATVMTLTGCSQSSDLTDTESTSQTAISFDTYLAKTRAGVSGSETTGTLMTNGFGVFAYYTTQDYSGSTIPNFMYNTKVTGSTTGTPTTWNYTPLRYWPNNDGKVSFFAYAPYVEVKKEDGTPQTDASSGITKIANNSEATQPYVNYNLGGDITNCVDLLRGVKKGTDAEMNVNLTRTSDIVGFTFKHALAKFQINAKASSTIDPSTIVTIESIKIYNTNLCQTGTLNLVDGKWNNAGGQVSLTMDKDHVNINKNLADPLLREVNNTNDINVLKNIGLTSVAQSVMTDDNSCYLIPVLSNGTSPTMTIEVKYWVRTIDNQLQYGATSEGSSCTITKTITFTKNFESNKQYSLTLNIGLKAITFDAGVSNWEADAASPDAVDISVNNQ